MSSVATTAENSAARKSLIGDEDDPSNMKDEMNYLMKEVEEKNKEIEFWRSKARDEAESQEIITDLKEKLQQALSEAQELKAAQDANESQLKNKYIEKSQHNKEILELKAKVNYLTSENERLNKMLNSRLDAWQSQGNNKADSRLDEEEKKDLIEKLESYNKENERLEKIIEENAIEILEWKNKCHEFETETHKLKTQAKEDEEEIAALKKSSEDLEKQIVELRAKKERLKHDQEQSQEENDRLVKSLEAKKKEIEEIKTKLVSLEKKEAEFSYVKGKLQLTQEDNENLYMKIAEKDAEIEELKMKCAEFDKNLALKKELEAKVNKLNIENLELSKKLEGRNKELKEQKDINQDLTTELNETQANLRFAEQENNELRQITEGYERMIEDLKDTVVKGEKGTYRVLSFDPDSLA